MTISPGLGDQRNLLAKLIAMLQGKGLARNALPGKTGTIPPLPADLFPEAPALAEGEMPTDMSVEGPWGRGTPPVPVPTARPDPVVQPTSTKRFNRGMY